MKRKVLPIIAALFCSLGMVACGNPKASEESVKPSSAAHKHSYVVDTAATKAATCEADGEKVEKCECGDVKKTTIPALGHEFVAAEGDSETALVHPEKCGNNCGLKAYRLDIAQATGWNKATTKWNARTTDESNNQVEASWDITGLIPAGKYSIQLEGLMSYTSHGNRYFYNQWETDTASSPDQESESPFRYYFGIDDGDPINPDTQKSWSELGYEGSNDSGSPKFATIVSEVTVPANAAKFSAFHGDIGYSMIVSRIRLVEIKA